jgi:hypothetical protein
MYVNDINCSLAENIGIKLFADDTVILFSHDNLNILNKMCNETFVKLTQWLNMNKLSLNLDKTFGMFFNANKKASNKWLPQICYNGSNIQFIEQTKYLGMIIDSKLSFKSHIFCLISKLRKWISIFRKINPLLSSSAKYLIYNSLFYSNLLYGIELYGSASKSVIKPLQVIQNKALRALFNYDKYYSASKLYLELGLQDVNTLFKIRASIMLKSLYDHPSTLNVHQILKSYCTTTNHKYNTRDKKIVNLKFNKPSFTSSHTFNLFLLWNSIPSDIKKIDSKNVFKHKIKNFFFLNIPCRPSHN